MPDMELGPTLWSAADILRGTVEGADYKSYIFPLLFFKRISDVDLTQRAEALADYGEDLTEEIVRDYTTFNIPEGCHWSDLTNVVQNRGVRLQEILDKIQAANPESLAGIFGDVAWGNKERLPEQKIEALIDTFSGIDLSPAAAPSDALGDAYEYLLKQFADTSGKKAGEFFTPRQVVKLLTRITDPQENESIYDPTCGSAGILIEALNEVKASGRDHRGMQIYGQESNLTTAGIARMNLFIHGRENFDIRRGDTLMDPKFKLPDGSLQRFDVVMANPPFSYEWNNEGWESDPYGRGVAGVPPKSTADFAWVQHMLASLNEEHGRMAVVLPHGVLFRGNAEADIRRYLVEHDLIEAVIGLPKNLFYGTSIPVCILVFRATKPEDRKNKILFINAEEAFVKGKPRNEMTDANVQTIVAAYETAAETDAVRVASVGIDQIEINNWDMNIGRYVRADEQEVLEVAPILVELHRAQVKLREIDTRLDDRLEAAGYA